MKWFRFDQEGLYIGDSENEEPRTTAVKPEPPPAHVAYWNGQSWSYVHVSALRAPRPTSSRKITKLAFRMRFLPEERERLELSASDNPNLPAAARRGSAKLRALAKNVEVADFIDLDHEAVVSFLVALEDTDVIEPGRAEQIRNAPVMPDEEYR